MFNDPQFQNVIIVSRDIKRWELSQPKSYFRQSVAEAESLRADGDSEGDEDDEHGVFGGRGAALVPVEAVDQSEHLIVFGRGGRRPY